MRRDGRRLLQRRYGVVGPRSNVDVQVPFVRTHGVSDNVPEKVDDLVGHIESFRAQQVVPIEANEADLMRYGRAASAHEHQAQVVVAARINAVS